jgi:hypothetical protein
MQFEAAIALNDIMLALEQNDRSAPFDGLLRQWWRSHVRAPAHAAAWSPPVRRQADHRALEGAVFVSAGALKVLTQSGGGPLICDLAIPVQVIRERLFAARSGSTADLMMLLDRLFRPGLITEADQESLILAGIASEMPVGWREDDGLMARYTAGGVAVQDLATELETRAARVRAGRRFVQPALARSGMLLSVASRAFCA